ncbi:pseudouridine-5'-phosphate glycosidase, partial [Agromyces bracchium]|uniref:pseudouridine-5'-phosphate glycosidase n=1 Tax=Agromyces bracchium TaxID=88376 RepID=UPI0031DCC5BC
MPIARPVRDSAAACGLCGDMACSSIGGSVGSWRRRYAGQWRMSRGAVTRGHTRRRGQRAPRGRTTRRSTDATLRPPHTMRRMQPDRSPALRVADRVRDAVAAGRPVLALESTILTHGLPSPRNLEVGLATEALVRE